MAMQMINGFSCSNCAEIALAKRGIDPHEDPSKPKSASGVDNQKGKADQAELPEAVDAANAAAAQRAPLTYTQNLDRLA
jgi:hypothetical protein